MKEIKILLFTIWLLLVSSCQTDNSMKSQEDIDEWRCPELPVGFQISDLTGTWVAEYGAAIDTIEIRSDGQFRQTYKRFTDDYQFSNSWNNWWLEQRDSGGLYLHLEGMRRCDNIDALCYLDEGGGGQYRYWDFCENRKIRMPNSVILMVTGVSEKTGSNSNDIRMWHMSPSRESGSYFFELYNVDLLNEDAP